MKDRSLTQTTLTAQIALVIPLQFCPGNLLRRAGRRWPCKPAPIQEADEALHDEGRIGLAFSTPARSFYDRQRLCIIQFRDRDRVRLHRFAEKGDAAQMVSDRAPRVGQIEKM